MAKWYQVVFYRIVYGIFWILAKLLTRCEFYVPAQAPGKGPLIVAVNHLHVVDPALVMLALPLDHIAVLIGEKWAESWIVNMMVRLEGGIYVRRGARV
jgi:1-acyl-sn-glycerol-3-phosphate acyltransferase